MYAISSTRTAYGYKCSRFVQAGLRADKRPKGDFDSWLCEEAGSDENGVLVNVHELFGHKKGAFTGAIDAHQGIFSKCSPFGSIFILITPACMPGPGGTQAELYG
jgi:hypothetical protein